MDLAIVHFFVKAVQQGYFDSGLEGSAALTDSTSTRSAPHYGEEETILAYMTHVMLRLHATQNTMHASM